jgi:hypothetical protein
MRAERRVELAAVTRRVLPDLLEHIAASWRWLVPSSPGWSRNAHERAREAARATLEGLATILEQGDLNEHGWERVSNALAGEGHATPIEQEELLRSVRVVGLERLNDILVAEAGLTRDERWTLQQETAGYIETLMGGREEPGEEAYRTMLAELEGRGPDLRP